MLSLRVRWAARFWEQGEADTFCFMSPKAKQGDVTAVLSDLGLLRLGFRFEPQGSQVIER